MTMVGRNRSVCRRSATPCSVQCSSSGVEQAGGPAGPGLALGEVGHEVVELGDVEQAVGVGVPLDQPQLPVLRPASRSSSPKITSSRLWARECTTTTSSSRRPVAQHAHHRGDAAAGGEEQDLGGLGLRAARSRRRPGRAGRACPAVARRTRWLLTLPSGIAFTVIVMRPSAAVRRRGERVGAPLAHPVDVDADPDVLTGLCGRASRGPA